MAWIHNFLRMPVRSFPEAKASIMPLSVRATSSKLTAVRQVGPEAWYLKCFYFLRLVCEPSVTSKEQHVVVWWPVALHFKGFLLL